MNGIEAESINEDEKRYHYSLLWVCTILFGFIGLVIANGFIQEVKAKPELSEFLLSNFQESLSRGSLLCFVLFYFYFRALSHGMGQKRYISTFVKLTIWSTFVVFTKVIIMSAVKVDNESLIAIYALGTIAHLDSSVTFGAVIFPVATLYMVIGFILSKLKS